MSTPNPETAAAVLPETAYSFGGDLDPNGVDLPINFPITRWHALGVLAGAAVVLTSCGVTDGVGELVGGSGTWIDGLIKQLAESPVEIIVPMVLVGYLYGTGQAFAKTISESRKQQISPEQSPTFTKGILPVARGQGMDLSDPDQVKALAKTMAALRLVPSGEQPEFWNTLWERVKDFSQAEGGQWATSGSFLYMTLVLMDSINRMAPDNPSKWGTYAMIAGAAYLAFDRFKEAIKPVKQ